MSNMSEKLLSDNIDLGESDPLLKVDSQEYVRFEKDKELELTANQLYAIECIETLTG
jgi:hypothetical protein